MFGWDDAAILGGSVLGGLLGGKKKGPNVKAINDRYMAAQPGGYLTAADEAQVGRTRMAGTQAAERGGALGRQSVYRQVVGRGLSGASAAALGAGVDENTANNRESAALGAANQEYGMYGNNRDFAREQLMTGWQNEITGAYRDQNRADAQNSTFWNSMLEAIPAVSSMWSGSGGAGAKAAGDYSGGGQVLDGATKSAATYNPSVASSYRKGLVGAY